MPFFRKDWTAHEADNWTKEDFWACVFSSLAYIFLMIGLAFCFLLPSLEILIFLLGLVFAYLMYRTIDSKLRVVSGEYEARQKEYLKSLDRIMKWEDH